MTGSTAWVFHINFSIGGGQQVPVRWGCVGSKRYHWFKVVFRKNTIAPSKSNSSQDFFFPFLFHNSGNKMPKDLSGLLSEMHGNIFTRRLRGSACAADHRLSDSILLPNKHRPPLKRNKHRQRVKGMGRRSGIGCLVLDLVDGLWKTYIIWKDTKKERKKGNKESEDQYVVWWQHLWHFGDFSPKYQISKCDMTPLIPVTFTFKFAF